MKRFRSDLDILDMQDPGNATVIQELWRDRARRFLKRPHPDGDGADKPAAKKMHRVKSYEWMLCLDASMMSVSGKGLDSFIVTDWVKDNVEPHLWPMINVGMDQGGDGICAHQWLKRVKNVNIEEDCDEDHGNHNDLSGTIQSCGMWGHQKLMDLASAAHQGPWGEACRHFQLVDAVHEAFRYAHPEAQDLLEDKLYDILEETGELHMLDQPGIKETIVERMLSGPEILNRGGTANPSRFMDPVFKAEEDNARWSMRALAWSCYFVLSGKTDGTMERIMERAVARVKAPGEADPAVPTAAAARDPVKELRQAGRSGADIAFLMYNDVENKYKNRIIQLVGKPFKDSAGILSSKGRSIPETFRLRMNYIKGDFFNPIWQVIGDMTKKETAEYLGLTSSFGAVEATCADHPQCVCEDDFARLYVKFALTMCGKRMIRKLPALRGWTGRSILL
jgi:hypothetical protein